jgi:hypothetical protein
MASREHSLAIKNSSNLMCYITTVYDLLNAFGRNVPPLIMFRETRKPAASRAWAKCQYHV